MVEIAVRATGISKNFGSLKALKDVSFELEKGEVHCLAGENGCGKSTLIKIINGVHKPESGAQFQFGNEAPISRITPSEAKARGIHVIWQDLSLFPDLTVAENIVFDDFVANPLKRTSTRYASQEASAIISELGVDIDPSVLLSSLSIAKRQLVAICRVLRAEASIIFMDEPTASLTKTETENLLVIVRKLSARGISVVFVSHRLGEVLELCSRVTVLRDGQLVGTFPTKGMTQKKLSNLMTGFDIDENPREVTNFGETILELQNLSRIGEFEDVSFALQKGQIIGLTGLLGSGRTELAHVIFGMTQPTAGSMTVSGAEIVFNSNRDAIQAGIAYVSEDRLNLGLHQSQSIIKNTGITTLKDLASSAFYLKPQRIKELCLYWIDQLKTKVSDPSLPVSSLSGGNQQRVVLAKWLATKPKVLILDAPTVGVDVGAKAGIFKIIRKLADEGMAILLISDEASEIHTHSDRVLVLRNGKIARDFAPSILSEEELEGVINA